LPIHTTATPDFSTLSLHDALPIFLSDTARLRHRRTSTQHRATPQLPPVRECGGCRPVAERMTPVRCGRTAGEKGLDPFSPALERSEEHTSELQSRGHLVCRLLLEK